MNTTTPDVARMAREYRNGASIRELALRHGCSYGKTHRVLADAKVEFRSRGGARRRNKPTAA